MKFYQVMGEKTIQMANQFPMHVQSALNRTATQLKKDWAAFVAERYNVTTSQVTGTITSISRAGPKRMSVIFSVKGRRLGLMKFPGTKQSGSSISFEVVRGQRSQLHNGFQSTVNAGSHKGYFERFGEYEPPKKGRYAGRVYKRGHTSGIGLRSQYRHMKGMPYLRQKIREFVGLSIPQMMTSRKVMDKVRARSTELIQKYLLEAITRVGGKKAAQRRDRFG